MEKISELLDYPKTFCSIDASTNSLAFAIFTNKELTKYGKIMFLGSNTFEKVGDAAAKTGAVLRQFNLDAIVIEHTVYMNSPKTMADLAMVQGALLGSAINSGIKRVGSINPITWQTFIGNGKLTKEEQLAIRRENPGKTDSWYKNHERSVRKAKTLRFVNTYFDINVIDNDVADAIGIGYYSINNWSKVLGG
jgi:Holliday junction resolvasome RuvABC endonuclease subunit